MPSNVLACESPSCIGHTYDTNCNSGINDFLYRTYVYLRAEYGPDATIYVFELPYGLAQLEHLLDEQELQYLQYLQDLFVEQRMGCCDFPDRQTSLGFVRLSPTCITYCFTAVFTYNVFCANCRMRISTDSSRQSVSHFFVPRPDLGPQVSSCSDCGRIQAISR